VLYTNTSDSRVALATKYFKEKQFSSSNVRKRILEQSDTRYDNNKQKGIHYKETGDYQNCYGSTLGSNPDFKNNKIELHWQKSSKDIFRR
jgi:hypothetical protein